MNARIVIGIITVFLIISVIYDGAWYASAETLTITVTKTDRITETSGSGKDLTVTSKYLVFTENETFENTDSWLFWKFNSSDFNGKFVAGSTYKVKVAGWRIPFFSSYRNIVSIY